MRHTKAESAIRGLVLLLLIAASGSISFAQAPVRSAAVERGSQTAKGGFRNEDEIRDKFNKWREDEDAKAWLRTLGHDPSLIESVYAFKPHGDKADVVVTVKSIDGPTFRHGISIKLVSSPNGFNQIDKRWLRQYAKMWNIPSDVVAAMRLFVGEDPPNGKSRRPERMFLTELEKEARENVVAFFTSNKQRIVEDLIRGEGANKADFFMVAWKPGGEKSHIIVTSDEAVRFFSEGPVEVTRSGNLKIGRITMQRKGGDGGRESAKMLQFKLNPALLFSSSR
ncbi:MAG: type II restriction endonuclease [Acidobacteriota bacterium]|nr:MAG: type II restriction endonuclease [Acidobacteriota bacterium]